MQVEDLEGAEAPALCALDQTASLLAENILASSDTTRADRLWPADAMVFQTNALNVAYGATGTSLFLFDVLGCLPANVRGWLVNQPVDSVAYPPGLYSGIAGIAWSFAEIGLLERACELMRLLPRAALRFDATDMFDGCAGWGLAALALFLKTGYEEFRSLACEAGDFLVRTAEHEVTGSYWRRRGDGLVALGFGFGGSGIGLFLLYLWRLTDDERYLTVARDAMMFEVAHGQVRADALVWGTTTESEGHRPYWLRGGAGVATALIRFAQVLQEPHYEQLARRAVEPCGYFFSAAPHLFEGLAGMGESLLDMYFLTGETPYLTAARQKAEQALLFQMNRPVGVAFPGRYLLRISHDYGIGGAGIGSFLRRVSTKSPRRFHDIGTELGIVGLGDPS
jgi:lantibiotic modifying enzyme